MNWLQHVILILVASLFVCTTCQDLGKDCTQDTECTLPNSYCNITEGVNKCVCSPAYVPEDRDGKPEQCLLKATNLEEICEIPAQCKDLGDSECLIDSNGANGKCVCPVNAVPSIDAKRCLAGNLYIGLPCEENQQCVGPTEGSVCNAISKTCQCQQDWVSNHDNSLCLRKVNTLLLDECTESVQCRQGVPGAFSECDESLKKCNCTTAAVAVDGKHKCYQIASEVGSRCEENHQCEVSLGESFCDSTGLCECKENFIPSTNGSKCLQKMQLEQPCVEDGQCSMGNARCLAANDPNLGNICNCTNGYIGVLSDNKCYPLASIIGGLCSEHEIQCKQLDADCIANKTCQCAEGDVENIGKTRCLKAMSNINGTCEQTVQCNPLEANDKNRICHPTARMCQCEPNQYVESWMKPDNCVPIRNEFNERCVEHRQCIAGIGNLTECEDGVCQCRRDYVYRNGTCHNRAALGQICHSHEECYVGVNELAHCDSSTSPRRCRCQPGTIDFGQKCYINKVVGDTCDSNIECTVSIQGHVQCDASTKSCRCTLGYSPDAGNTICSSGTTLHFQFSLSLCVITLLMSFLSTN